MSLKLPIPHTVGRYVKALRLLACLLKWVNYDIVPVLSVAPMKALCAEKCEDWTERFGPLGLKCKELTGDTELDDYFELQDVHIILTTPVHG